MGVDQYFTCCIF